MVENPEQFIFLGVISDLMEEKYFNEIKGYFREGLTSMIPALRKHSAKLFEGAQYQIPSSPGKHWELPIETKLIICLRVVCKVSRTYEAGFELLE
jgi:hypothetical protein